VTADVAYGIRRYFEATQDSDFMAEAGAEILLETERFWASPCVREAEHYRIHGVTGPDEDHHTVDDNAYTSGWPAFICSRPPGRGGGAAAPGLTDRRTEADFPRSRDTLGDRRHQRAGAIAAPSL
jgi:hypothetical protein